MAFICWLAFPRAALPQDPSALLDRCAAYHASLSQAKIHVTGYEELSGAKAAGEYEISFVRPDLVRASYKLTVGSRVERDATLTVQKQAVSFLDRQANHRLTQDRKKGWTPVQELATMPASPAWHVMLFDPQGVGNWLKSMRKYKGWKLTSELGYLLLQADDGQAHTIALQLDKSNARLLGCIIGDGKATGKWAISYDGVPQAADLAPPSPKATTSQDLGSPKYKSPEAKALLSKCFDAHGKLPDVQFVVTGDGEPTTCWYSGGEARQDNSQVSWAYESGTLTIVAQGRHAVYQGRCEARDVPDFLSKLKVQAQPLLLSMLKGRNPIGDLLGTDMSVSTAGSMQEKGAWHDLLMLDAKVFKLLFEIRRSDGLLVGQMSQSVDPQGKWVSTSRQTIIYESVGKTIKPEVFALPTPKGFKVQRLDQL